MQANLAGTAVEAVIPEWRKALREITEPWFGVHQATEVLLREISAAFTAEQAGPDDGVTTALEQAIPTSAPSRSWPARSASRVPPSR